MNRLRDIPKILKALKAGQVQYTIHAYEQMNRRKLSESDVKHIGGTCAHAKWQEDRQTYLIVGYATDGKGAAVCCKIDEGIVVVTVMRRHLTKTERSGT